MMTLRGTFVGLLFAISVGCMANPTPYPQADADPTGAGSGADKQGEPNEGGGTPAPHDRADDDASGCPGRCGGWAGDVEPTSCPDAGPAVSDVDSTEVALDTLDQIEAEVAEGDPDGWGGEDAPPDGAVLDGGPGQTW